MILQSLDRYYYRLLSEKDSADKPKVPDYGYSDEKIGWILVLNKDGQAIDAIPHLTTDKKPQPKRLFVPQSFKRPGTTPKPFFLWDKTSYALGITTNKDKATKNKQAFIIKKDTFESFKKAHLKLLKDTKDVGLRAFVHFLETWSPEQFARSPFNTEMIDANIVFKLDGQRKLLYEQPAAQALWEKWLNHLAVDKWFEYQEEREPSLFAEPKKDATKEYGTCLISGCYEPIARTHPAVKEIWGGQSSGCSIVSFNDDAFESFGKKQGANAPISEYAAFAYVTALNYLLQREHNHCFSIGDTSTVFWAEAPYNGNANAEEEFFYNIMNIAESEPVTDGEENQKVFDILQQIAKGRPLKEIASNLHADTRFYILGLAPNASRISIRFWLNTTFGQLAQNLSDHWQDLAIEPCPWQTPPSIWRLLIQTAPLGKTENISPVLAGEITRAVINGTPYPMSLLSQLLARIRADGNANGLRIAMIKAILTRKSRKTYQYSINEGVPMGLDKKNTNPAYLLGRLFAVLEYVQYSTLGKVNASIADRYYGSASTTPFFVFPRLLVGARHHLARVRKDKPGLAINLEKDLGEIIHDLPDSYPRHFNIDDQGRFSIAYYQQKQSYFAPKDTVTPTEV